VDRRRRWVFAAIAAVYLLGFNGQWQIEPDSALYLILARSLALGRGYTYEGTRQETAYPGLPVALAGIYRIVPNHIIFAADVLILGSALAALALLYRLVLLAYDRPTAVVIVCGVAFSLEFVRYSQEILTDMPFLTGVLAVLAGHEAIFYARDSRPARWWDWAILFAGLMIAISTRPTMIGLLIAWIAALLFAAIARRNRSALVAICCCLGGLGVFVALDPRRVAGHGPLGAYEQYAIRQLTQFSQMRAVMAKNAYFLFCFNIVKTSFGMRLWKRWINAVFGAAILLAAISLVRKRLFWGLWVIVNVLTLLLTVSDERYLLPILPLLALGWWNFLRAVNRRWPSGAGNWIVALLLVMGTGLNLGQVFVTVAHQRASPFLADYQGGKYLPFARMARELPANTSPADVVVCPPKLARMMNFLTDRTFREEHEEINAVPGHLLVILDPADADYSNWLAAQGITPQGEPLVIVPRSGKQPAIQLTLAELTRAGQ